MAIALTRQMLYRNSAAPHPEEAHKIDSLGVFYAAKEDGKEGIAAFLEKREAQFTSNASEMPAFYDEWIKRR